MYEERKDKFSFKSFFLTLLLVLLFVFLLLWIFPTKWDIKDSLQKDLESTYDLERLSVLYDEIFANNVARMKDAAIGYFTNERMPQKVGDSKKLTLQEMYDLHLVLKMKDKDGKACDVKKSYVQMTKYTEEYRLKVNLSCGDYEDYIIVYLGCYDYCSGELCEKRVSKPSQTTAKEEQKDNSTPIVTPTPDKPTPDKPSDKDPTPDKPSDKDPTPDKPSDKDPTPVTKKYMYEYSLKTPDKTTCTDWSDWQKDAVEETNSVKVETKTSSVISGYKTTKIQTGTKTETVVKKVNERYISGYSTKLVAVGTKKVQTGTTTKAVSEKVAVGTVEKYVGIDSGSRVPADTATTKYKVLSTDKPDSCSYCENETTYIWEIYSVETVYDVVTTTVTVPVYKTVNVYEKQSVPIYDYRIVEKEEKVVKPVYVEVKLPEFSSIKYYRYQTCTVKKGTTDLKWSYSKIDSDLIGKGYKLTGNVKEV